MLIVAILIALNLKLMNWKIDLSSVFLMILLVSIPLKWIGSINGYYYVSNSFESIDNNVLFSAISLFDVFVVVYYLSYYIVIKYLRGNTTSYSDYYFLCRFKPFINTIILFLPGILLLIYKIKTAGFGLDYFKLLQESERESRVGGGLLNILETTYFVCAPLLFILYRKASNKKLILTLFCFTILNFLNTGGKHAALLPMFIYFGNLYVIQKKKINFVSLFQYILLIFILISIIPYTRVENPEQVESILQLFFFAFDAGDNYLFIFDNVKDKLVGDLGFHYYFDTLIYAFLPRSFFPSKREIFGFMEIQRDYLSHLFMGASGETVSISIVGEAFVSFGVFGVINSAIALGVIMGLCQKGVFKSYSPVIILVIFAYLFEIIRGGTRSISLIIILIFMSLLLRFLLFKNMAPSIPGNIKP